jgi:hypothetical protein
LEVETHTIKGPDGRSHALAKAIPKPAPGEMDVKALNTDPDKFLGKTVIVNVLTRGAVPQGFGDGPAIACFDGAGMLLRNLDFVIDKPMVEAFTALNLMGHPPGGPKVAARIRGTIQIASSTEKYKLVNVDEVTLLTPGWIPALAVRRGASVAANAGLGSGNSTLGNDQLAVISADGGRYLNQQCEVWVSISHLSQEVIREGTITKDALRVGFFNKTKQPVAGVKIYVPADLAPKFKKAYEAVGGGTQYARLGVKVTNYDIGSKEAICWANTVQIVDKDFKEVKWLGSTGTRDIDPGIDPADVDSEPSTPVPPDDGSSRRVIVDEPEEKEKPKSGGGNSKMIWLIVLLIFFLLLLFGGVGIWWVKLRTPGVKSKPKARDEDEDDDIDDDDDEDESPRSKRKR